MMSIDQIKSYYPAAMADNAGFQKHLLKEYVQLLALDFLSATEHVRKLTFIGGTNLRLVKGVDRFSEDLDFDCKGLSEDEFAAMADDVMFLMSQTKPDYSFLAARCGIHSQEELKTAVARSLEAVDRRQKQRDFEHLLFHRENSRRILHFAEFIRSF